MPSYNFEKLKKWPSKWSELDPDQLENVEKYPIIQFWRSEIMIKIQDLYQSENVENAITRNFKKLNKWSRIQIRDLWPRSDLKFNHFFLGQRYTVPHNLVQIGWYFSQILPTIDPSQRSLQTSCNPSKWESLPYKAQWCCQELELRGKEQGVKSEDKNL